MMRAAMARKERSRPPAAYWSLGTEDLTAALASSAGGLSHDEAAERLLRHGRNKLSTADRQSR